jgi:predicted acetyltransferase
METVAWDAHLIGAKLHRAQHGRVARGEDASNNPVQSDWNFARAAHSRFYLSLVRTPSTLTGKVAIRSFESGSQMQPMTLVWPSREYLPSYVAALERGWSPDNLRGQAAADEELERVASDPDAFLASLVDKEAAGGPITLPDGTTVPRLPGYHRWLWDGEFCGSIGFRWQRGTEALPPHCLGHIGYAVVPWKQRRGYATRALRELLGEAKTEGLRFVEITTSPDNLASRRVVEANGGVLVEEFIAPISLGGTAKLKYRVTL